MQKKAEYEKESEKKEEKDPYYQILLFNIGQGSLLDMFADGLGGLIPGILLEDIQGQDQGKNQGGNRTHPGKPHQAAALGRCSGFCRQ